MESKEILEYGDKINGFYAHDCREFAFAVIEVLENPAEAEQLRKLLHFADVYSLKEEAQAVIDWYRLGKEIYMEEWNKRERGRGYND